MKDTMKRPAVGTEFFEDLRQKNGYYVDKTGMIGELLRSPAKVFLFTRPRRFGKTLNMTMLKSFFEIDTDPALFNGLAVFQETDLCERYMGKHPVVFVTLKDMEGRDFNTACHMAAIKISREASRFEFLRTSPALDEEDRESYAKLRKADMDLKTLAGSLGVLCDLLEKHFGQKAVLLIDEYDVPLQKAFYNDYYDEMIQLIRSMFSQALKTNDSLELAVLTGCLRVSKESIFTGINNLQVLTIMDTRYDEYFGFTDGEVREMLEYYGLSDAYGAVKKWYNGYRFGREEVYCPWDVINYVDLLLADPGAFPENFWANSSGNDVVREFVRRMDTASAREELQVLTEGGTICKEIRPELTYRDMYRTVENLWSLLFMTGYLTSRSRLDARTYELAIPNREINDIFMDQIMELFRDETEKDGESLARLCGALASGNAAAAEEAFGNYLRKVISVRDTMALDANKENFYHGFLLGILSYKADWIVTSNRETGDGYGDILVRTEDGSLGLVIEVKYARDGDLEQGVRQALRQIEQRHYDEKLRDDGIERVLEYGIACYRKRCRIARAD